MKYYENIWKHQLHRSYFIKVVTPRRFSSAQNLKYTYPNLIVEASKPRLSGIVVTITTMGLQKIRTFATQCIHTSFQINEQTTGIVDG